MAAFKWQEGMKIAGTTYRVLDAIYDDNGSLPGSREEFLHVGRAWSTDWIFETEAAAKFLPDTDDPATCGCLVAQLRGLVELGDVYVRRDMVFDPMIGPLDQHVAIFRVYLDGNEIASDVSEGKALLAAFDKI